MINTEYLAALLAPEEELRAEWSSVCQQVIAKGWPMPSVTPWGVYGFTYQGIKLVGHLLMPAICEVEQADGKTFLASAFFCPFWMQDLPTVYSMAIEIVDLAEVKDLTQEWAKILFGENVIKFPGSMVLRKAGD